MCGIAGAIGSIDSGIESAVRAMMAAEAHRGPDDNGLFRSEGEHGVVLGFQRLSILDLSPQGHQPMIDGERHNAVVFNGEIYNYTELRRELEQRDVKFGSSGDTEVLLRGYGCFGAEVVQRLRGMYAFAIFDQRRRSVLIARDRLGIKPLYYCEVRRPAGPVLLFASELRALLASGLLERRLDPYGLSTYLWNGFVVGPSTMIRGIKLLGPGELLRVSIDQPTPQPERYWSLEASRKLAPDEAIAGLKDELVTAARQHLASDVPLGVFLSGGVDSSAVAALAVQSGSRRVKTFHIGFEEAKFDESSYARRVADSLGTEHAELRLTQARFQSELLPALASLDQPTFDALNTYFVSRVVREAGFTVALAGTGGDELFGGYRSFRDLPLGQRLARMVAPAPDALLSGLSRAATRLTFGNGTAVPPQTRWAKLGDLLLTRGNSVGMYQVAYGLYTREFLAELADSATLALAPYGLLPDRARELEGLARACSPLSAIGLLELSLFIGERLLRDTDAASMASSLEVRVPLLDHRVVEAAQTLPDDARFMPLGKKRMLKQLALSKLDPTIFDRPKSGFVLPIEVWAKDSLAGEIESTFADHAALSRLGFRPEVLVRLFRAFQQGSPGIYWSRIWAPFVLLNWCKQHRVTL